jgi:lysophosphatidic acid acyltransferase / lysophosphatidylinositol acyltransferase
LIEKFNGLGCTRGFVKNAIKYIPICGWFFGFAEHIFLQRNLEKDKAVMEHRICEYATYPNSSWMVITAEGTRFTKEKHETSIKFAKEKNVEPFKHHLIPRPGGYNLCVPLLKKYKCPAIYNFQLAFDRNSPTVPTLGNLLLGKKVVAHVYLERIPMENVEPTFEFLYKVYKTKDALQDSFHKHGNFFEGRGEKKIEGRVMPRRPQVLINTLVWMAVVTYLMIHYSIKLILGGRHLILLTVGAAITAISKS